MSSMKRLRLLVGLLGCLAILTAGLPAVASATVAKATPTSASEPCQHCPDCDGAPCQTAMADCVLTCVATPPALAETGAILPAIAVGKASWSTSLAVLHGLTRPPDPFPPRS